MTESSYNIPRVEYVLPPEIPEEYMNEKVKKAVQSAQEVHRRKTVLENLGKKS